RCVLLDVPRHRGTKFVTEGRPVHGWELDDILTRRKITLEPGDAVAVYSGREAWQAQDPEKPYSKGFGPSATLTRPGLKLSCLPFARRPLSPPRSPRLFPVLSGGPRRERAGVGQARRAADRLRHPVGRARLPVR